jgi:hypothetical protein
MSAAFLARAVVTAIAGGQGIMPVFIDLNRTHATNPQWPGHARFHLVHQVFTLVPVAAIEIVLLWWPGREFEARFYLAALLTGTSLVGFLLATLARPLYGGKLHDPNGIQPLRLQVGSRPIVLDMNLVLVLLAAVLLPGAVLLFWIRT